MDELLLGKPCTKPKVIIKSATISIDGDNDEEKTRAENVEPNENIPVSSKEKSENLDKPLNCVTAVTGNIIKCSPIGGPDNRIVNVYATD